MTEMQLHVYKIRMYLFMFTYLFVFEVILLVIFYSEVFTRFTS